MGNSAAVPALQALGHDVLAVPTITLSHHPAHASKPHRIATRAVNLEALVTRLDPAWLGEIDAVTSGYLASADQAGAVLTALAAVRREYPKALFACDPVCGDDGGLYVPSLVYQALRDRLLPAASLLMPNRFELGVLTGMPVSKGEEVLAAARSLSAREVVVSSVPASADDCIATLAVCEDGAWLAESALVEDAPHGTGDLLSALYLGRRLRGEAVPDALAASVASVHDVLSASTGELALVAAQRHLADPATRVEPVPA